MRIPLFALIIILILSSPTGAQSDISKNLQARLKTAPLHKQPALLNELAEAALTKEPAKAEAFAQQALARARSLHNTSEEARALINLGEACLPGGRFKEALSYGESSAGLARQYGYRSLLGKALNLLGKTHRSLGNKTPALLSP
jgi:tetratricopeptide (TPR) repeat protein